MNKEFKIKLIVRVTLKEGDLRDAIEHRPWRYSAPVLAPLSYIKSSDEIVSECTIPYNLDWDIESDMDRYANFISGVLVQEGLYEISAYVGDQEISQRNYVGIWKGDAINIQYSAHQDILEQINDIHFWWSLLEDNTNSHYTKLFTEYTLADLQDILLNKSKK